MRICGPMENVQEKEGGYITRYWATCPSCGVRGTIDHSQYIGNVSVVCPECDYHETHDHQEDQ